MAQRHHTGLYIGDPAPEADRVSGWSLALALLLAPAAWTLQLIALASVAGLTCGAGDGPGSAASGTAEWVYAALTAINLVALALAAGALLFSWHILKRTGETREARFGGVLDSGEGRTRFIAAWAVFTSILFILAIAFNTVSAFWVGLCDS